jgi:uncharacterized protein involved in outer membrane biogenesis
VKKVVIVLLILAALGVAGVLVLLGSLDAIVKAGVERIGSDATLAPVTLDAVDISPQTGKGALRGFQLGNPEGFATDAAIRLGEIRVHVDTSTLASDTIVVKEVLISGPEITYEISGLGNESNIAAIRANVDAYMKRLLGDSAPESGSDEASSSGGKKIVIEKLRIEKGRIHVSATFLAGQKVGAELPPVELTDLGKDEGGLSPEATGVKILEALTKGVGNAVSALDLGKLAKGVKKGVEDAVDGVLEGAKGIFGK